jgi:murein L,D-transpeptidase YcbB/YkuD
MAPVYARVDRRMTLVRRLVLLGLAAALVASSGGSAQTPASPPPNAWTMGGRPTPQALQVIDALRGARTRGLDPAEYDGDTLRIRAMSLIESTLPAPDDVMGFERSLSRSLKRFLEHLHVGRIDPRVLGLDLPERHTRLDIDSLVRVVSRATDAAAVIATAEPSYVGYADLERALAHYRALAADPALQPPPSRAGSRSIRPGERYAGTAALRRWLAALGDLPPTEAPTRDTTAADVYAGTVISGIVSFQRRHGLDPDGIIGASTMAELRVPPSRRVRQIELTLERWRWFPDRPPPRYAVVNVPAFRVYAFEDDSVARHPSVVLKVIVGEARNRHATPMFTGTMQEVVFRPSWEVPTRIARTELVPLMRRHPDYVEREEFDIVRQTGTTMYAVTPHNLDAVAAGTLRLRQRPGAHNALGLIKFLFPNQYNVYMHGTPNVGLFARSRRDFSHGCIRVEDPTALAEFVLRGQKGWDRDSIEAAQHGTRTFAVPIARPVSVYVAYLTAVADADGIVSFYPDLYGHDAALEKALASPTTVGAATGAEPVANPLGR